MLAAAFLLLAAPARAESYRWGPIFGSGEYRQIPFSTTDAELIISYVNQSRNNTVEFIVPEQGIDAHFGGSTPGGSLFQTFPMPDGLEIVASDGALRGSTTIQVFLYGDVGPLDPMGQPESLAGLVGGRAFVRTAPEPLFGLYFVGSTVPEPSALLLLALGIGGVSVARAVRRMKKRPGP
jgi:hypothetical protein